MGESREGGGEDRRSDSNYAFLDAKGPLTITETFQTDSRTFVISLRDAWGATEVFTMKFGPEGPYLASTALENDPDASPSGGDNGGQADG